MSSVAPHHSQRLRVLWQRLSEPTLVRRSVASVMVAFVLVWAVLLGYNYLKYKQAITYDPGMLKYGDAVLESLADLPDASHAAAALASTDHWTNVRRRQTGLLPGALMHELRDGASGRLVYAASGLQGMDLQPPRDHAGSSLTETTVQGQPYRIYAGRNARWTLRILEPKRPDADYLHYNGRTLVPYLLLAAPFVLLPVWLSVRNGLRPLQQLAQRIAQRSSDELQPVGFDARHRELKPLEQSLDALLARLRQKVERERAFVQDAAHEIRTPLAVITAQAHVMARSQSADERTEAQAHLEQAIARTSHLAQQLLDLAALDEAQRPAPRDMDVAQWLRAALAQAAPAAMAQRIELSLDAPDSVPARLDATALESVVHNLIDNAVRYAQAGGSVAVGLRRGSGMLHLSVQDDGPGIAPAERGKVFERFYRGTGHAANGSGLGLAIVRQAARRMGGQVQIGDGLNGQGVGFFVSIPLPRPA
ncbi:HAMP domain-containing sensor histidine kinase [Acidovorax sp. Root217]|uniref:sensor histidine kinase n=1 Tax=Acidovorax sp. Root217 TaxID=1736492 RepID=UPI00070981F1|nr:HAMP domain-containing sensor histidine kinase [Acidovorax sp. Root217]KRC20075.1 histidine kinase [Acidovorax sp. Root217]